MGYDGTLYNIVLILHLLSVIIGFGSVFLNGIYGSQAKANQGPGGLAISRAMHKVSDVAGYFIYAVFVFGLLLVFLSKSNGIQSIPWSDPWLSASMLLYFVGLGLSHGALRPAAKKMLALQEEMAAGGPPPPGGPPPQVAEMEQLGKRVALVSGVLNVLLVVLVTLMVFKPGAEYIT